MGAWEIPALDISLRLKAPYSLVLESVLQGLKHAGFAVVTEIDLQETLKRKLNVETLPFKVMRVYNPGLTAQAYSITAVTSLLPYSVTLAQMEDGDVEFSVIDPLPVLTMAENPELVPIISQAYHALQRLADSLPRL
jgi:uncharacterized protein (DUF302 family)